MFRLATSERLERAVKRAPGGEAAASRYVAGRTCTDALDTAARLLEKRHGVSVDIFGERVSAPTAADHVLGDYLDLARALPPPPADAWLSVDLSHLALVTDSSAVAERLAAIASALPVWPQYELDGLVARDVHEGGGRLLPIWHGLTKAELLSHSPSFRSRRIEHGDYHHRGARRPDRRGRQPRVLRGRRHRRLATTDPAGASESGSRRD